MVAPQIVDGPASEPPRNAGPNLIWNTLVVLGILCLVGVLVFPAWLESKRLNQKTVLKTQLKQIGIYLNLYESKYKSCPPDTHTFETWLQQGGSDAKSLFSCHRCGRRITFLTDLAPAGSYTPLGGSEYAWTASGITADAPPDLPLAWHRCPLEKSDEELNVLYFLGRVDVFAPGSSTENLILKLEHPAPLPK